MKHIILILITLALQACAAVDDSKKSISLDQALYFYESTMRWADFTAANSLRRYEGPAVPGNDPEKLARIKVTAYETISTRPSDDNASVYITARISYYDEASLKVMTLTDNQVWEYDKEQDAWHITTPLPVFK